MQALEENSVISLFDKLDGFSLALAFAVAVLVVIAVFSVLALKTQTTQKDS